MIILFRLIKRYYINSIHYSWSISWSLSLFYSLLYTTTLLLCHITVHTVRRPPLEWFKICFKYAIHKQCYKISFILITFICNHFILLWNSLHNSRINHPGYMYSYFYILCNIDHNFPFLSIWLEIKMEEHKSYKSVKMDPLCSTRLPFTPPNINPLHPKY